MTDSRFFHQTRNSVRVTPEVQDSLASPVQVSLGWSFDELVQRALRDPQMNQQLRARGTVESKRIAMQNLANNNVYTHPIYMDSRETTSFIEDFNAQNSYYAALEEQAAKKQAKKQAELAKAQLKEELRKEIANESTTGETN